MIRIYRHVFWLGVGLIVLGLYLQALAVIMIVPSNAPVLAIGDAFRNAPRDSLFTDASDAIGSVIAVGGRYENLAGSIGRDGFACWWSELRREEPHLTCMKEAWSLRRIMPRKEAWTIEIIWDGAAYACTVKDLHASIGPA